MKVLYYYWNENPKDDCVEAFSRLGHDVGVWAHPMCSYTSDEAFWEALHRKLKSGGYDCIFSFDYFPMLSEAAEEHSLPYFSWVYDSPHYTLESDTLANPCNHVFIFDYALAERYRRAGFDTVDYLPLPVNTVRLDRTIKDCAHSYGHDITFVGSLYNNEFNFYDQIKYLPDFIKGFLDGVILSQQRIYGYDLATNLVSGEITEETAKFVSCDLGEGFRDARSEIIRDMLRKKVTVNERHDLLEKLGERFSVDLYSASEPSGGLPVNRCGTVDYVKEMPKVFASSRINLNITLRSILTGIPLRVIDILGSGGFCLSNYQAEFQEYFENGKELVWFESPEDMMEKAGYYLKHDPERERIARTGREAARDMFSYDVLLPKLLQS